MDKSAIKYVSNVICQISTLNGKIVQNIDLKMTVLIKSDSDWKPFCVDSFVRTNAQIGWRDGISGKTTISFIKLNSFSYNIENVWSVKNNIKIPFILIDRSNERESNWNQF